MSISLTKLREDPGYIQAYSKIKSYRKGFEFRIQYENIPQAKATALQIVLRDCVQQGLIKFIGLGLNLDLTITEETFVRV